MSGPQFGVGDVVTLREGIGENTGSAEEGRDYIVTRIGDDVSGRKSIYIDLGGGSSGYHMFADVFELTCDTECRECIHSCKMEERCEFFEEVVR